MIPYSNVPQLRRSVSENELKDFPNIIETPSYTIEYKEYVVFGRNKQTKQIQQMYTIRVHKNGMEGGICGYDCSNDFEELTMYEIEQNFKFKKITEDRRIRLEKAERALNG